MLKVNYKTLERRHRRRSGVFIVNLEHISLIFLEFLSFTLSKYMLAGISDCSEAAVQSHPFPKIFPRKYGGRALVLIK